MNSKTARLLAILFLASAVHADCTVAWGPGNHVNDTWGAAYRNLNPAFAFEREVADDFEFSGNITRVYVSGFNGGPTGSATPVSGVWVRFYAWTATGPGAQQASYFVPGNSSNLGVEPRPSGVDVVLPTPFVAIGRHFVSVQIDFTDYGSWDPWRSNQGAPRLSTGFVRVNAGAWGLYTPLFATQPLQADVDLVLFTDAGPSCSEWQATLVPAPNQDSGLVDVVVLAANDVWALGNKTVTSPGSVESFPFALHHDGTTWSIVDLPATPPLGTIGSRSTMEAIDGVNPADIWAAGAGYVSIPGGWVGHQIRVDHYDGATWTTMNTPLPPSSLSAGYSGSRITDIEASAANDVWFVGEWVGPYPGVAGLQPALAMHWNGSSFTLVPTPELFPIGGNGLEAIDGVSPNDLWAVGGGGDGDLVSYSYILHWNGTTWMHVPGPTVGIQQRLWDVVAIASHDVWTAGEAMTTTGLIGFVQHWDGSSWSTVTGAPTSFGASFHANAADDLWLGLWHWDGFGWTEEHVAGCEPWADVGALGGGFGRMIAVGSEALPGRVPYVIERVASCAPIVVCAGDGTSAGCPCGNHSRTGSGDGCLSSLALGARLRASGTPSVVFDSLLLVATQVPNGPALYFQGAGQTAVPFGDGLLCAGGPIIRLGIVFASGNTSTYPSGAAPLVSVQGLDVAGDVRDYQIWYRDAGAFCTAATFNLSNALRVTWAP